MYQALAEIGVATTTSLIVCESIGVDNLLTALITFGISVITVVGGELIKFLVAFFKNKTSELENKDKKEE